MSTNFLHSKQTKLANHVSSLIQERNTLEKLLKEIAPILSDGSSTQPLQKSIIALNQKISFFEEVRVLLATKGSEGLIEFRRNLVKNRKNLHPEAYLLYLEVLNKTLSL